MPLEPYLAYGYELGGPGRWRLEGFAPGQMLRTDWYDDADPSCDFRQAAFEHVAGKIGSPVLRDRAEERLPWLIDEIGTVGDPDRPAPPRYVLIVKDSAEDIHMIGNAAVDSDWEPLLAAALVELELVSVDDRPKWLHYDSGSGY
ncbi:hypothetical protein AB0M43_14635 [Longispora sp. NPDC051575]|uniref:hypothetical protein n=1 Tax=Longispora sp. NPDC051575 TaxID=3154943 RepID=UPI00343F28B3